ncbi:MAG: 2-amino-4-hydroxy-6-hydroxymethyldihydropteridine diphosphokinase [Syntrophomonadaceae bacterium]|nr:2-amino-4-hydroxy-6-hydroxymethyldihydropteridine diphosphokinase [Syntrophomonadaceae bacterium]
MKSVYIGLGSNSGEKAKNLQNAVKMIENTEGINVKRTSSFYLTAPWGRIEQEEFVNQVIEIETDMSARDLLDKLQEIEIKMGRLRRGRWGPRIIDLDILLYGDEVLDFAELKVPHPYMRERLFVLVPLQEIAPNIAFPDDGTTIEEVLGRVLAREGNGKITRI